MASVLGVLQRTEKTMFYALGPVEQKKKKAIQCEIQVNRLINQVQREISARKVLTIIHLEFTDMSSKFYFP